MKWYGQKWFSESSRNGEGIREDKSKDRRKRWDWKETRGKWLGWWKVSLDKPFDKWALGWGKPVKQKSAKFVLFMQSTTTALPSFFSSLPPQRHTNNKQNTNAAELYPSVLLRFLLYAKIFLIEADLSAMLKITKWFNVFWHPRIYLHSHLLFSLITSTFNPNLLHTHFMRLKFHRSPNSKANSDNKHLLLRLFGSLASNMLTKGMSHGVVCYCCWRITIHQTGYWIYIFCASCMTKLSPKSASEINK